MLITLLPAIRAPVHIIRLCRERLQMDATVSIQLMIAGHVGRSLAKMKVILSERADVGGCCIDLPCPGDSGIQCLGDRSLAT